MVATALAPMGLSDTRFLSTCYAPGPVRRAQDSGESGLLARRAAGCRARTNPGGLPGVRGDRTGWGLAVGVVLFLRVLSEGQGRQAESAGT